MAKVIIYSDSTLDSFYEKTLQYLHDKYHVHPSNLSNQPFSPAEREALSYNDSMGRDLARHARSSSQNRNRDSYHSCRCSNDINYGKAVF